MNVEIREVGPRDGLQDLPEVISTSHKVEMIERLSQAGLRSIEVTSFVRPDRVPALADAPELCSRVARLPVHRSVFVANLHGAGRAIEAGVNELSTAVAATESMNHANFGCGTTEMIERARAISEAGRSSGTDASVTIAVAFGCPYEGQTPVESVLDLAVRLHELGFGVVYLGDTIGSSTPSRVESMVGALRGRAPGLEIGVHLHDARGTALAGCLAAIRAGATRVDSSILGLGGCPFAPGAAGNVCTEDLVDALAADGFQGTPDPIAVFRAARDIAELLGLASRSRALQAPFYQWRYE